MAKKFKTHYTHGDDITLCGCSSWNNGLPVTKKISKVTCKTCLRILESEKKPTKEKVHILAIGNEFPFCGNYGFHFNSIFLDEALKKKDEVLSQKKYCQVCVRTFKKEVMKNPFRVNLNVNKIINAFDKKDALKQAKIECKHNGWIIREDDMFVETIRE